jgi:hypothetical protein
VVCSRSFVGVAGSNSVGLECLVFCEYCVLSGIGLCVGPITPPEESHRLCSA